MARLHCALALVTTFTLWQSAGAVENPEAERMSTLSMIHTYVLPPVFRLGGGTDLSKTCLSFSKGTLGPLGGPLGVALVSTLSDSLQLDYDSL